MLQEVRFMQGFRRPFALLAVSLLVQFVPLSASAYQQIELLREVGETGRKPDKRMLQEPRAIAIDSERAYIADMEGNRVQVLSQEGKVILSWGRKGDQPGEFRSPSGIALDAQGNVYVADTDNARIQVFTSKGKVLRTFGSKGAGPKQFHTPLGIAVQGGLLFVADSGNSRVQVLTTDGIYLTSLKHTVKKEEMREPVDVAVDAQYRIHVLDADGNNVRVFELGGKLLFTFGNPGRGTDGFDEPLGLALDDLGNIFIADTGNAKIKKFDGQGKLLGAFGSEGIGPGQFRIPTGIKVDGEGRAYIVDRKKGTLQVIQIERGDARPLEPASPPPSVALEKELNLELASIAVNDQVAWGITGDRIVQVLPDGNRSFGTRGSEPGQMKDPRGIALDGTGNIWVADTGNDRLQKFNPEGSPLQVIGRAGSGEGELSSPTGVAVTPKGNVVVADTGNRRVQVFSPKGVFLGAFNASGKKNGQFREPVAVAVDADGNIYVADRGGDRIMKHDNSGNQLWETGTRGSGDGEFDEPGGIAVSPDGEVYVLDRGNGRVQVLGRDGKFLRAFGNEGKGAGELEAPTALALDGSTRLLVSDRGNKRVQVVVLRHTPRMPDEVSTQPRMNEVQLSWKANTETYLETYAVYRADDPAGPFSLLATTAEPFYVDRGLPSNRSFHYRVSSRAREGNESAWAAVVSAVTPRLIPSMPKGVRLDASEKQIALSWLPNKEPYVTHYQIYRTTQLGQGFTQVARTDRPLYVDGQLADETLYYYQVTAVGKEGDESPPTDVAFATTPRAPLTAPPVDIAKIEIREIFASAYKHYESHPLGKVVVRNNTDGPAAGMKLTFTIKDFMDFPTEVEVPEIGPRQEIDLLLKPVFSNRILEVTENTPLQSEIALTFYAGGEARTIKRSFPVTLYERHAMTWDRATKIGAFVTPKDPPVTDFARGTIQPYVDTYPNLHPSLTYARVLYGALGVYGLSYIVDPSSPYQEFSEKAAAVDYLQYPRDTLARKSGDCDDLSVLFASALENIGVGAALVDVPGHVFVLFNTGVPAGDKGTLGFPDGLLVLHNGTVWVPVEMTIVGTSFTRAWQKGAEQYRDWAAKGKVAIIDIQKAWEEFRPVTLPSGEGKSVKVKPEEIEARFPEELEELARQRLVFLSAEYLAVLRDRPADPQALAGLGILYGENGMHSEALEQFQKLLAVNKEDPMALNNIGNIYFLQERLAEAQQVYELALKVDPEDTGVKVNLARVLLRLNRKHEAKQMLQAAASADPRVLRWYGDLAAELGITK
jgi:DNA-binding beta-propeller fold protein YncE/tetratricopeptide (TPR) repeat protein